MHILDKEREKLDKHGSAVIPGWDSHEQAQVMPSIILPYMIVEAVSGH